MSTFSKSGLANLVREQVRPVLLPCGFVQKGLLFHRELEEVWHLIGFQKSVNSSRDTSIFTVNLGVSSKRIQRFRGDSARPGDPERPDLDDCDWNARLGHLGPQHDDVWWTVSSGSLGAMAEVVTLLRQHGIPELEQLSNDVALRDLWRTGRSPGLTEGGRLMCLSTLVALLGPAEELPALQEQMRAIVERRPAPGLVRQLKLLERI